MGVVDISLSEARALALAAQGLGPLQRPADVRELVTQLGYIQIDTISVVQRAHFHVLWVRNSALSPASLEAAWRSRQIFEYWWHAAAYLPMAEYRFTLPFKSRYRSGHKGISGVCPRTKARILARIRAEGPLSSSDFAPSTPKVSSGWWDWSPEKRALEQLFLEGRLMVTDRKGFQKRFDLAERVVPPEIDLTPPEPDELAEFLVRKAAGAHGVITVRQMAYLRSASLRTQVEKATARLMDTGELVPVRIEGSHGWFAMPSALHRPNPPETDACRVLSPFDNLVIQRDRLSILFGFSYVLECYLPAHKRTRGYFALPILCGSGFAGTLDAKVLRKERTLLVRRMVFDRRNICEDRLVQALQEFAAFNGCTAIAVEPQAGGRKGLTTRLGRPFEVQKK